MSQNFLDELMRTVPRLTFATAAAAVAFIKCEAWHNTHVQIVTQRTHTHPLEVRQASVVLSPLLTLTPHTQCA